MSLQIRRGTNAERLTITPRVGELIYVTDHITETAAPLWVGDGVTPGGNPAISEVDVGSLNDLEDVNVVGATDGQVLGYDSIQDIWNPIDIGVAGSGIVEGSNYRINIAADDSTIMVDASTGEFNGTLNGDVNGSVFNADSTIMVDASTGEFNGILNGEVIGQLTGDVKGSVFNDDSSVIVDSINSTLYSREIFNKNTITTDRLAFVGDEVVVETIGPNSLTFGTLNTTDQYKLRFESTQRTKLQLIRQSTDDLSTFSSAYGSFDFTRNDPINGEVVTSRLSGGNNFIYLIADETGAISNQADFLMWREQKLGIGTSTPADTLDVRGSATISDTLSLAPLSSAPASPIGGMIAVDDGTDWSGVAGGVESIVAYVNTAWVKIA